MIRLVVFDFDGTLVDSNGLKRDCMSKVVAPFPGGEAALQAALRGDGDRYVIFDEVARKLDRQGDPDHVRGQARAMIARYTHCCAQGIAAAPERRGARSTLAALKERDMAVWIASATPQRDLLPILRRRGLMRYLDGALGKPASKVANLRKAMREARVGPRQTLMVGDGPDDLAAARAVGAWFFAITAEQRIAEAVRFASRDLRGLLSLMDRLFPRPRRA